MHLRFTRLLLLPLAWSATVLAAATPPLPNTESSYGQWVFSFLPKAFQKNPLVDQTVITELTDAGKKLPLPSKESPAYYLVEPGSYREEGHGAANRHPPIAADLENSMKRALAVNGYIAASPEHPPSLLIIFHWGQHTNLDPGSDDVAGSAFVDIGHRNLLSRAALVGGTKFAVELKNVLQQQDREDEVAATLPAEFRMMMSSFGPLKRFCSSDPKKRQLYEQAKVDCYFVIASAYDYSAATRNQRVLLWRSKMSVDSQGVSMADTLPGLIQNAGKYFGRDMPEPATITRRMTPVGKVELSPLELKEYLEKPPAPTDESAPRAKEKPKP